MFKFAKPVSIWLGPDKEGRIKRCEFSRKKLLTVLGIFIVISSLGGLGLWGMISPSSGQGSASARLLFENRNLKRRLTDSIALSSEIESRLNQLDVVLKNARPLDPFARDYIEGADNSPETLLSGDEDVQESLGGSDYSSSEFLSSGSSKRSSRSKYLDLERMEPQELIARLDRAIKTIRYTPLSAPVEGWISSSYGPRRFSFHS